jgi:hypothetical protein
MPRLWLTLVATLVADMGGCFAFQVHFPDLTARTRALRDAAHR